MVCSFILSPGRELFMQPTSYVARVLFGFFNICTATCSCWRRPHQSRYIVFRRESSEISDGPLFPWDLCYPPRLSPANPIWCLTELHLVVASSFIPKKSCGLIGFKTTCLSQKVLPLAQHPLPLRRVRAAGAAPAQPPK